MFEIPNFYALTFLLLTEAKQLSDSNITSRRRIYFSLLPNNEGNNVAEVIK